MRTNLHRWNQGWPIFATHFAGYSWTTLIRKVFSQRYRAWANRVKNSTDDGWTLFVIDLLGWAVRWFDDLTEHRATKERLRYAMQYASREAPWIIEVFSDAWVAIGRPEWTIIATQMDETEPYVGPYTLRSALERARVSRGSVFTTDTPCRLRNLLTEQQLVLA